MPDQDIPSLFPENNPQKITGVTRQNARAALSKVPCPRCGNVGQYALFNKAMHVGIACTACGREHPLRARGVMWLGDVINAWKAGKP